MSYLSPPGSSHGPDQLELWHPILQYLLAREPSNSRFIFNPSLEHAGFSDQLDRVMETI